MKHCPQCSTGYPDTYTSCPTHGLLLNEIRDLKPGMIIHQSYRIIRKLGQGGMGAVYLAQHILMDEPRALKFLSPELSRDQAFTGRFLREVRVLRQIRNRNVVDCGDLEAAEDGSLFFSMEFVDGPDLRGLMNNTTGPFRIESALSIARQIAEGLGAAHSKGMVHRDIKPENILMARDGDAWLPKIADFGIVATKESSTAYTRTGGTLLTMAYAAPEQWRGTPAAELDGRTDLYALGGLLYEMLTGRTAFHAENYEGWSEQHRNTPPQPPSTHRPDLANWRGLDALVLHLLAKDRNDRPKDVAELLGLLNSVVCLPLQPVRVPTVRDSTPRQAPALATPPVSAPAVQRPVAKPPPPRHRGQLAPIIVVVLLIALCLTGAISYVFMKTGSTPEARRFHLHVAEPRTLYGNTASVETVAFSPDGRTLASGDADNANLWDVATGQQIRAFKGHTAWVFSVAFSPDGRTLATASVDNTIKLWDVASGRLLRTLEGHTEAVQYVAYSPDGAMLASASSDRTIKLWDAASGRLLRTLLGHSDYVISVAFSPDGRTLVSGSTDHLVMLWDTASGKMLRALQGHTDIVLSVKFSPDGRTIASGSWDRTTRLWDAASGQLLATLQGLSQAARSIAFSPDGSTLATAGDDGTIKLWDTDSRKELATLDSHFTGKDWAHQGIRSIAFSPDGRTLASGLGDYSIRLWDVSGLNAGS
ncbi:MAG TPA: serine/threonine-protein kinase [Terracidiphilus sp.]|jgi:WD40 repeat protein/serine/threonine protein kinase